MSIQLNLFWTSASQLEWYWAGEESSFSGSLEDLLNQKKQRNLDAVGCRLLLPDVWFSNLSISVPGKTKRLSGEALKFACEEYLAQDIEDVHLIMTEKPRDGAVQVLALNASHLRQAISTLETHAIDVYEAFSMQGMKSGSEQMADVELDIQSNTVTFSANGENFQIHTTGFSQWFSLWAEQSHLPEDATVFIRSDDADGPAKMLSSELQASGHNVQWQVEDKPALVDLFDQVRQLRSAPNLMQGEFSRRSSNSQVKNWLPLTVAAVFAVIIWAGSSLMSSYQTGTRVDQVWAASESVFLQVFGKDKRIQRPLMVREMRSVAMGQAQTTDSAAVSSLDILNDLVAAPEPIFMEDFRFNQSRREALFTLVISSSASGDAYSHFEKLNTDLKQKGYQVEYSANQDNDRFRARFKAVFQEAS